MDNDDVQSFCKAIIEAGIMARPYSVEVDLSSEISTITEAIYELVGAVKGIDCEIANLKNLIFGSLDNIDDHLCDIKDNLEVS